MSVRKGQARLKKIASLISADKPLDETSLKLTALPLAVSLKLLYYNTI